jgi:nucleotide-binding universal stress UspA family protein
LEWIIGHSSLVDAPILPVVAFDLPATADGISSLGLPGKGEKHQENAKQLMLEAVAEVDPKLLDAAQVLQEGHVGQMLVAAAVGHDLLVVGSRGRSAFAEALLGSVGSFCVSHSHVPVAIIPQEVSTTGPITKIIVGVDGSENAQAALQWAADHAPPTATVEAVGVFSLAPYAAIDFQPALDALEDQCRHVVDRAVSLLDVSETDRSSINIVVHQGDPRNTLRTEASGADLLVLGARGHRGVAHLLLGSVTTSLAHHPTVATVVVPSQSW